MYIVIHVSPLLTRAYFGVPYNILISLDSGSKSDALCACTMWEQFLSRKAPQQDLLLNTLRLFNYVTESVLKIMVTSGYVNYNLL